MTMRMWDMESPNSQLQVFEHHTEFTVGCDFNMFNEGQIASCAWDETVHVWNQGEYPQPAMGF